MKSKRVTQKDIAKRAGVHRTTVSLAMKNFPGIPESTRAKIFKIAEKMGYTPDPMLSALASYRIRSRPVSFHGCMAWLVNHQKNEFRWDNVKIYREYFQGAKQRAATHGYTLEAFDLNLRSMTPQRLASVLTTRNIQGIVLCPQLFLVKQIFFPFDNFSVITFGHSVAAPRLHSVATTQYRNTQIVMHRLSELGYRKIGYVSWEDFDQRTDNNYWAGYLVGISSLKSKSVPPLKGDFWDKTVFKKWYEKHRPDAIVTPDALILEQLQKIGVKAPRDIGVACLALPDTDTRNLAGIYENPVQIGSVAVDLLTGMINRGEHGIPEFPQQTLVEGTWFPGDSLRHLN